MGCNPKSCEVVFSDCGFHGCIEETGRQEIGWVSFRIGFWHPPYLPNPENIAGKRKAHRLRLRYFRSVLADEHY